MHVFCNKCENRNTTHYFRRLWKHRKYLSIEPFFLLYLMAIVFNTVALKNFPLEKACRVNLKYNKLVCDTILDKSKYGIQCDNVTLENTTMGATYAIDWTVDVTEFNFTVCKAELEAQQLTAQVAGRRTPIAAIFPLFVVLFAGGFADRYNKRKLCMIFPVIGETLAFLCLIISSIFFETFPMEFGMYLEKILPALFGGVTFCFVAGYSHMTLTTPEEDRVFRFGLLTMFLTTAQFLGQPWSGVLFQLLGYTRLFTIGFGFLIIAILYMIFFVEEAKAQTDDTSQEQKVNVKNDPKYAIDTSTHNLHDTQRSIALQPAHRRSFCREFFDFTLIVDCTQMLFRKRPTRGRMLLFLLVLAYFLTVGPASGETDYWYPFTLKKLNWNGKDNSLAITISAASRLIGTFIGTAILSKILRFADSTIAILSGITVVISRLIYAFSTNSITYYTAVCVDMFYSLRVIAIRTIGSSIVGENESTKLYVIFGFTEPIGQFFFPPLFGAVYAKTVERFAGAIFLFAEIFYVPNVIIFVLCYFLMQHRDKKAIKEEKEAGEMALTEKTNGFFEGPVVTNSTSNTN